MFVAPMFGIERVWAAIYQMQFVTNWLSAHADKLKFNLQISPKKTK